ncbi:MAG: type II toxin-antitoxin system VapC family toxin [Solirubrobacteraceae bacterium]
MRVVDASTLCDFLLGRDEALSALTDDPASAHEPLHAPEVIELEVLNALRRLLRQGLVSSDRAAEAVADLGDVRLVRYPHGPLRDRVWDLRDRLSAYDAAYVALAEALGDSILLTSDTGLASRARVLLGRLRVRHIPSPT